MAGVTGNNSVKLFLIQAIWFRCWFEDFLSRALAALILGGAETFMQFLKEGIMGKIHVKLFEPVVHCQMSFKRKKLWLDDRLRLITIAHL